MIANNCNKNKDSYTCNYNKENYWRVELFDLMKKGVENSINNNELSEGALLYYLLSKSNNIKFPINLTDKN